MSTRTPKPAQKSRKPAAKKKVVQVEVEAAPPLATWRRAFLEALAHVPNVSRAARIAGISRRWAYKCFEADPDFAQDWQDALDAGVERLEEAAYLRAVGENVQYKFHPKTGQPLRFPEGHELAGQPYFEHVASDTMATLLLKAHRPEKYKDRSAVDVNATVRAAGPDLSKLSDEELAQWEALSRKALPDAG